MTLKDWQAEAVALFGPDSNLWRFRCPACGHVQTRQDFLDIGLSSKQVDTYLAFSCIGRFRLTDPLARVVDFGEFDLGSGCTYVGGRTPNVSPVELVIDETQTRPTFDFART